jgi:hypothetical protein
MDQVGITEGKAVGVTHYQPGSVKLRVCMACSGAARRETVRLKVGK